MWAAEAGRKLQNFDSAAEHYRDLINDKSAPPEIQSAALFHYGELLQAKPVEAGGDPLSRYRLALEAFTRVLDQPEFAQMPAGIVLQAPRLATTAAQRVNARAVRGWRASGSGSSSFVLGWGLNQSPATRAAPDLPGSPALGPIESAAGRV